MHKLLTTAALLAAPVFAAYCQTSGADQRHQPTVPPMKSVALKAEGYIEPAQVQVLDMHLSDAPPGGYFPSSTKECPVDLPVDSSLLPSDHSIPPSFAPKQGTPMLLGPENMSQGQIRIIAFDGNTVLSKMKLQRTYTPPVPAPHTWTINIVAVNGIPARQVANGYDHFADYTGPGFRYRLELCVDGAYKPISSPEKTHGLMFDPRFLDDTYYAIYGSPQSHPAPDSVQTSVSIVFPPKQVEVHIDAQTSCTGIPGVAAYASNSAHAYVIDHDGGSPLVVANLGATLLFDGTVHGEPGTPGPPSTFDPFHPTITAPNDGHDTTVTHGYIDPFPYGSPITKSDDNIQSITADENSFGIHIGGPCRGFEAVARARLYDGQIIVAKIHSR